jgi:hypothetical protein
MRPSPYDAQAIMMAAIYNGLTLAAAPRAADEDVGPDAT